MIYRTERIKADVRRAMDENMADSELIGEGDRETLELDALILSKIEEAARRVELEAPAHLLEEGHKFGEDVFIDGEGRGWTFLPDDFMRLISFRMSDWECTLYGTITPEDPLYEKQSSRYRGVRGNPQKPVCAIVNRPEGKALEFYSCRDREAHAERATYLPYPKIDADGGIDICERCYDAVVNMTASLVLAVYGERGGQNNS